MTQIQLPPPDIFGQIGLDNLSNSEKLALMETFGQEFAAMLAEEIDANLTDDQKAQLDRLDQEGDENKINEFLTQQVKDFDAIYARTLQRFLAQTKTDVQDARVMVKKALNQAIKK